MKLWRRKIKPENKKEFLILMAMLAEAFGEKVSSERGKIYFEFLQKIPFYKVTWAIKRAIRELRFFPKISEIIDLAGDHHGWCAGPTIEYLEQGEKKEEREAIEYVQNMAKVLSQKSQKPLQIERKERSKYADD